MASIYERALGEEFGRLHPRIRERFGFSSGDGVASVGEGVMHRIWASKWTALPLLIGASRHIMFPESGTEIPFTIENFAYRDGYGRETVTWNRHFTFRSRVRHFDATMIYSSRRRQIVDYLGNKQHLAVDLELAAAPNGGIRIRSGDQRFYEGWLQFPFPAGLTGTAEVCEWFDDAEDAYKISVNVSNPVFGPVFGYRGTFRAQLVPCRVTDIPDHVKPLREELRE
ncbi:DUF4166 domain-containing protein [Paenibacillus chitinolyticus]|uniref:DUF4166 domain-containing protein n=1 Tax=Paenibacillus chitinolyticus TaxID=79263 RepID=UPI00386B4F96